MSDIIRTDFIQKVKKMAEYENILYKRIIECLIKADKEQMRKISDFAEDLIYN